ncbi:hypothetical protein B566_EDAN011414 [Ephemera danica]|nr:hypothetical protein B566_EDAN011414 [Ephemera danica]
MRCSMPSINFKALGKAILTLSRIGEELYVEPYKDGIYFRTVNPKRSAYASFNFTQSFFAFYKLDATSSNHTSNRRGDEEETLKCKVAMKSVLAVFRTPANNVESCQLQLDPDDGQLTFQLRCRHSVCKTYYVPVIECETVQAVYDKENVPNKFSAPSRVLTDVMQNFQKNHEEISLTVGTNRIFFRNYSDVSAAEKCSYLLDSRRAAVRTELTLEPLEFDVYVIDLETSVTFSLLELRALLMFAEATSLPVVAYFEGPGKPIIFTISSLPTFDAHFVLATMSQQQSDLQQNSQASTSSSTASSSFSRARKRPAADTSMHTGMDGESSKRMPDASMELNTADEQEQMEVEAAEENLDLTYATQQVTQTMEIPQTPPWLQAQRFFFPRCFRDSQDPKSPLLREVLCPDSDPEENV